MVEYNIFGSERVIRYRVGKRLVSKATVMGLVDRGFLRGVDFGDYGYLVLRQRIDK